MKLPAFAAAALLLAVSPASAQDGDDEGAVEAAAPEDEPAEAEEAEAEPQPEPIDDPISPDAAPDRGTQGPEIVGEPSLHGDVVRYPPSSARIGLLAGGIGMFGVAYGLSAMSASVWPEVPGSSALYAPVVGPLIALGNSGCAEDDPDCGAIVYVRGVLYVVDTLVQIGGLALIAQGLFMTTEADAPAESSFQITPHLTPTETGIGVSGRF